MDPVPQDAPPADEPPTDESVVRRPRPLLAILAVLVAAAMVAAALGGRSFVGPEGPSPDPTRTPRPAQADSDFGV